MIGVDPFRVSFSGGSTDIPLFSKKCVGKVISASIVSICITSFINLMKKYRLNTLKQKK